MALSHPLSEIATLMRTERERCDRTIKFRIDQLTRLRKAEVDLSDPEKVAEFVAQFKPGTQREYFAACAIYTRLVGQASLSARYSGLQKECKAVVEAAYEVSAFTDLQQPNVIEWDELMRECRKLHEAAAKLSTITNNRHSKLLYDSLIMRLYTNIPPQRLDFNEVLLCDEDPGTGNCYVFSEEYGNDKIVLREYKTGKIHGVQTLNVPEEMAEEVLRSLRLLPRKYLFSDRTDRDKPVSKQCLCNRTGAILKEKRLSSTLLRKIVSTEFARRKETGQHVLEKKMGHNNKTAKTYYNDTTKGDLDMTNSMGIHF